MLDIPISVRLMADSGRRVPKGLGLSARSTEWIRGWRRKRAGPILGVLLRQRTGVGWSNLGRQLVDGMRGEARYVGLGVEGGGACGVLPMFDWARAIAATNRLARVGIQFSSYSDPPVVRINKVRLSWCCIQENQGADWLRSVWEDTGSERFGPNGCSLLFTTYVVPVLSPGGGDTPLTADEFGQSLERADGWLVPLDGNLGFVVGLPAGCPLHEELMRRTP